MWIFFSGKLIRQFSHVGNYPGKILGGGLEGGEGIGEVEVLQEMVQGN